MFPGKDETAAPATTAGRQKNCVDLWPDIAMAGMTIYDKKQGKKTQGIPMRTGARK